MSKGPVHVIRFGLIKACIWRNHTTAGDRYSITVVRVFKKGEVGKESTRFGRDDLLLVAKACNEAHSWVYDEGQHGPQRQSLAQQPKARAAEHVEVKREVEHG